MCGIVGIVSKKQPVAQRLIDGLKNLEYRGYDSAGIAVLDKDQKLQLCRAQGKIKYLQEKYDDTPKDGFIGIAHTRWATHGVPSENNAHPHQSNNVAIVHNGIIENYLFLRERLGAKGYRFQTETDSEVIAHLIDDYLASGLEPLKSVQEALKNLQGAYGIVAVFKDHPDLLVAARQGSPLAIGVGDDETYLGSDAIGLSHLTNRLIYLDEGDVAMVKAGHISIYDHAGTLQEREITNSAYSGAALGKENYKHFMLKEIYEQPRVIGETFRHYIDPWNHIFFLNELKDIDWNGLSGIDVVACGTAYYSCHVAQYWLEKMTRLTVNIDIASEYRYKTRHAGHDRLLIVVSQSGETADTLAALRAAKARGQKTLAIVNVPQSSIDREADYSLLTFAGPEIGVASTKAYTAQLTVLLVLALYISEQQEHVEPEELSSMMQAMLRCPQHISMMLEQADTCKKIGQFLADYHHLLYLGRGLDYPLANEGALKIKEISYIHAESYASGELKHGPIALIDETMPIIALATDAELFEKSYSNIQEVLARSGRVILITTQNISDEESAAFDFQLTLPKADHPLLQPLLTVIPLQLIAYFTALHKGTDIDQPRNLAKSVTVE